MRRLTSSALTPLLRLIGCGCLSACAASQQTGSVAAYPPQYETGPEKLVGSTPQILTAEFGRPALLRVDGPAQIWLYHANGCGLNLILYPDAAGVPRVALATAADGGIISDDCPASLEQSHIDTESEGPDSVSLPEPAAALEPPGSS